MAFTEPAESIFFEVDSEALEALLKGPEIQGLWHNSLDLMRDEANRLAQTEGAEYDSAVHTVDPPSGQPGKFPEGGYIYTKNYKARIDDAYHETLFQVLALAEVLIEQAGRMSMGDGTTYEPAGRGSNVRGPDGRFVSTGGVKKGGKKKGKG